MLGRTIELPDVDIQLPLSPASQAAGKPDVRIEIGRLPEAAFRFSLDDAVTLHIGQGVASVEPMIELGPRALEHYLVDHAIPTALSVSGDLVIHAAGLARGGRAIALLGASGVGKSTTATALSDDGWTVLSDDAIRVEFVDDVPFVHGTYPSVRLHEDLASVRTGGVGPRRLVAEYASKVRLPITPGAGSDLPRLELLYFMGDTQYSADASRANLGLAAACGRVAEQLFLPPADTSDAPARIFSATNLVESVETYTLDFERSAAGVEQVVELLRP